MNPTETWNQIPVMTKMAIGARNPVGGADGLHFTVGSGRGCIRKIVITLCGDDTYAVKLVKLTRRSCASEVEAEIDGGVYCDQLGETVRGLVEG